MRWSGRLGLALATVVTLIGMAGARSRTSLKSFVSPHWQYCQ